MIRAALLALPVAISALCAAPLAAQDVLPVQAAPSAGLSEERPELYAMLQAMGIYELLTIIGMENIAGATDLEDSLFPGQGGAPWIAMVTQIHSADRMARLFEENFPIDALSPEQIADVTAFMQSDIGRQLVEGEVATRILFLDDATYDIATERFMSAMDARDERLEILYELNEVNDYIERNVIGALNLRIAFFRGLDDGGAFDDGMGEDLMLDQVLGQQDEIRQTTVEWLFSYQLTAYADVSDDDLRTYIEFGRSDAGRAMNAALFAAFDGLLGVVSYEMGNGAATFIAGEDT